MAFILYENLFGHMADLRAADRSGGSVIHGYILGERPVKMYFDGLTLPNSMIGGVDCSGSTLAAVYLEWQIIKGQTFKTRDTERLPGDFYKYWVPYGNLDGENGFREASAGAAHTFLKATVGEGDYNLIGNHLNLRRGDLVQIWWNGNDPALSVKKRMKGHAVFIHDTLVDKAGRVWFQVLSSQNPGHKDTDGIGVSGSKVKDYALDAKKQAECYRKGKWYRYEEDGSGKGVIPEMNVGRFKRPFPCWPCRLSGGDEERGPVVAPPDSHRYHRDNERSSKGGYFPIGSNRTWHGGIHLHPPDESSVYAIADGVIVAARCPEVDVDLASARAVDPKAGFKSRSFVLIRHQLEIDGAMKVFYSLYLHLKGDLPDDKLLKVRWLWKTRQTPKRNLTIEEGVQVRLDGGDVVPMAHPIGAGEIVGITDGQSVHVEIFSEADITDDSYREKDTIEDTDKDLIIDPKKLVDLIDEKMNLRDHIQDTWWGGARVKTDGMVSANEVKWFFQLAKESDRRKMRGLVCRHISEWSDQVEWPRLKEMKEWGYLTEESREKLAEVMDLYSWLDDDIASHCQLPADHMLRHYHPITFLAWLRAKVLDKEAENVVQDVTPFLAGAGEELSVPDQPLWFVNDDATTASGDAITELQLFGGSGTKPDLKKVLVTDEDPPEKLKDDGPWEEEAVWEPRNGSKKFVRISAADEPAEWVCVKWGDKEYAERRGGVD